MIDVSSDNKFSKNMLPVGKIRVPFYLYIILIILGILVLLVSGYRLYLQKQKKITDNKLRILPTLIVRSDLEVAKKTLEWLEREKDDRNVYTIGTKCNTNGQCETSPLSNRSGFSVLWSRNRLINKDNDEVEKNIFLTDVNNYLNKQKVKLIQNNFWNCLFMYRIVDEGEWNEDVNQKIKNICLESEYESAYSSLDKLNIADEEMKLKSRMNILIQKNNQSINENTSNNTLSGQQSYVEDPEEEKNDRYFYISADRLAKYLLTGLKDELTLKESLLDFGQSLNDYENKQNELQPYKGCYVGVASILLGKIDKDPIYLSFSKLVFSHQSKIMDSKSEKDVSICGFLADMLYKETQDKFYKKRVEEMMNYWKNNNYDETNGGFFTLEDDKIIKKVKFNGIFSGLLL